MEQQLFATLKIDIAAISSQLAKVITKMRELETAVNELQSTLSTNSVEVILSEKKALNIESTDTIRDEYPRKDRIRGADTTGIKISS